MENKLTLSEIEAELKSTQAYTLEEVKALAYNLLTICPKRPVKGVNDYIFDAARFLYRHPFNLKENQVRNALKLATANCGRAVPASEIEKAVFKTNPANADHEYQMGDSSGSSLAKSKLPDADPAYIRHVRSTHKISIQDFVDMSTYDARTWRTQDILLHRYKGNTLLILNTDKMAGNHVICLNSEKFLTASIMPAWLVPNPALAYYFKAPDGKRKVRCKENIKTPAIYLITEWDEPYTLKDQAKFIYELLQNFSEHLKMIVYSGEDSLHAWWNLALPGGGIYVPLLAD